MPEFNKGKDIEIHGGQKYMKLVLCRLLVAGFSFLFFVACSAVVYVGGSSLFADGIEPINLARHACASNAINTTIYRHHGIFSVASYQYAAFFLDARNLRVVRRKITGDQIEKSDIPGEYSINDTHNAISIGIDNLGYVHLSYGQHASPLRYRRSLRPWSISEWTDEIPMTGERESLVTYPAFIISNNVQNARLLFFYRHGYSGNGDVCIKEYDSAKGKWSDIEPCVLVGTAQEPWTSNAYLNHPAIDGDGNIHLSYVWRTDFIGENKILNNIGIDYALSKDWGRSWQTSLGHPYRLPITQVNSETVYAVSPGSNLINQTSSAVDSRGNPHVAFYANDENGIPQYQHIWFDGKKWLHSYASTRTEPFSLSGKGSLDIPISRPEILLDSKDRMYLIYRSDLAGQKFVVSRFMPPDYHLDSASKRILWDSPVGYAEPVIDRLRWERDEILSMFIQKSGPPSGKQRQEQYEPAYIIDWDLVRNWN